MCDVYIVPCQHNVHSTITTAIDYVGGVYVPCQHNVHSTITTAIDHTGDVYVPCQHNAHSTITTAIDTLVMCMCHVSTMHIVQ